MSRWKRQRFEPAGPFVVRRGFLLGGHRYSAGDDLPVGAISTRKARQLYDSGKILVGTATQDLVKVDQPREETKEQITNMTIVPNNWRNLANKDLFPLAHELSGKRPANRAEAFATIQGFLDGSS